MADATSSTETFDTDPLLGYSYTLSGVLILAGSRRAIGNDGKIGDQPMDDEGAEDAELNDRVDNMQLSSAKSMSFNPLRDAREAKAASRAEGSGRAKRK